MNYISNSFNIDEEIDEQWVYWIKNSWIPFLKEDKNVLDILFTRVLVEEELGGITYSLLIKFGNLNDLEAFEDNYFSQYFPLINSKFESKFVTFRTYLEEM